ncbi:ABC transporter permease [Prosthecomicrobium sp. N25]|uniref:ABC transporter permease n=1 Tax=Prosthecomicrobium sp. N25 TaxID=3129254 RepID=UPI0030777669
MTAFLRFVTLRAFLAFVTLVTVSIVIFGMMELVPGDCAERYLALKQTQGASISLSELEAERERLGLDRPLMVRWLEWITGAFRGDFGESCTLRMNITTLVGTKFLISSALSVTALLLAYAVAIPVGMISAASDRPVLNGTLRVISYLGLAIPNFLLALLVMLFSTLWFGETLTGLFSPAYRDAPWSGAKFADLLGHIWLPILVLGWSATAFALQTVRALMSDEVGKLYVTAARARGLSGAALLWRYPARHALPPIVNSLGFDLSRVFSDLPIVALILSLTDVGSLLIESLARANDQQLAGAIIFLLTATIVTLNFATDVLLAAIDPRVRAGVIG